MSRIQFRTKLKVNTKPTSVATTNNLRHKLAGISIEQAGYGAGNAVPGAAIVAGSVGKQADGEHTPQSAGAVHRDGADRIVDFEVVFNEGDAEADQNACDKANDGGAQWC